MFGEKFTKNNRLRKSKEYKAIRGTRLTVSVPEILLLAQPNLLSYPRLGLTIAKKQVKLAVQRNRIKRIARESFRQNREVLPNVDIVLLARKGIVDINNEELHQCLKKLWQQLAKRADCFLSSS